MTRIPDLPDPEELPPMDDPYDTFNWPLWLAVVLLVLTASMGYVLRTTAQEAQQINHAAQEALL